MGYTYWDGVKRPLFIDNSLNGTFIWESTYDGYKVKLGVKLTPIEYILNTNSNIYIRKIICPKYTFSDEKLREIHNIVYNKPYDIVPTDWIEALFSNEHYNLENIEIRIQ